MKLISLILPLMVMAVACGEGDGKVTGTDSTQNNHTAGADSAVSTKMPGRGAKGNSYANDLAFLKKHTGKVLELASTDGKARVLLSADYQGRVMTSSATGPAGSSYGWINYDLVASGEKKLHINPVGGEERFWLGPEGGQYSIYFKGKDSFNFEHWQVPPVIDTITYEVAASSSTSATFTKKAKLTNYSGTVFNLDINRVINLLDAKAISERLKTPPDPDLSAVAYETINSITNTGKQAWNKESGLLSIWLLAMLTPSDQTKVIIPFENKPGAASAITSDYFGPIAAGRLKINKDHLVFTCDGKSRGKIGLPPSIARPLAGSFDFQKNILTITMFSVDRQGAYVNSKWELQKEPYKGDAVNAYNDGPLADGTQMGPFYEIESSSAAKPLKPGEAQVYKQTTFHFEGEYAKLEALALKVLWVRLSDIK